MLKLYDVKLLVSKISQLKKSLTFLDAVKVYRQNIMNKIADHQNKSVAQLSITTVGLYKAGPYIPLVNILSTDVKC